MKTKHRLVVGAISAIIMIFVGCGKKSHDDDGGAPPSVAQQQKADSNPCSNPSPSQGNNPKPTPCATSTPVPIPTPTITPMPLPYPTYASGSSYYPGSSGYYPGSQNCQASNCDSNGNPCYFNCGTQASYPCYNDCMPPYAPYGTAFPNMPEVDSDYGDCGGPDSVCFDGGRRRSGLAIQLPGRGLIESLFERRDLETCLSAMADQGIDPHGSWQLQVSEMRTISAFGHNVFYETSSGPRVVLVKATSAIGSTDLILANPNALYCVKYTSLLDEVRIGSCWANNVIILKGVEVLSNTTILPLVCR